MARWGLTVRFSPARPVTALRELIRVVAKSPILGSPLLSVYSARLVSGAFALPLTRGLRYLSSHLYNDTLISKSQQKSDIAMAYQPLYSIEH